MLAGTLAAAACADQGSVRIPAVLRLVGEPSVEVAVGETRELAAECLDSWGRAIPRADVAWGAFVPLSPSPEHGRVTLDWQRGRARVRGVSEGVVSVLVGCLPAQQLTERLRLAYGFWASDDRLQWVQVRVVDGGSTRWAVDPAPDTLRLRAPTPADSLTGVVQLLTVRTTGSAASALDPRSFTWRSDDATVVTVAEDGVVRARGPGVTSIHVTRDAEALRLPVRVENAAPTSAGDVAIVDAHWTQGAQDAQQRVPMVRNGRAAVVNVLAFATPGAPTSRVTLEVFDQAGALRWTTQVPLTPAARGAPQFSAPSAQVLVPRNVLRDAARWRVYRDTAGAGDANPGNDTWPREGTAPLLSLSAAPLQIRLVPFRLAGNGNATLSVTPSQMVYYDSIARIRLPIAATQVSVEPPITISRRLPTAAELLIDPSADEGLYTEMLDAVDRRRLASGAGREAYWIGLIPKPSPDEEPRIGGLAYIPMRPGDTGPMSRSSIALGHDWYQSPVNAGTTVAHELGHNLGLYHAPCGNAPFADQAYPVPGGGVGAWVHWVSRWEHGTVNFAETIPADRGDLMGYCSSNFVGPYHTRAMLEWRVLDIPSLVAATAPVRVVAVRGAWSPTALTVSVAETMVGEVIEGNGDILVELVATDGEVLARGSARVGRLADGDAVPFVAQLATQPAWEARIARVRVSRGALRVERAVSRTP